MAAILLVTLSPEHHTDEEALIRQLGRWRIRGDAVLKFLARTSESEGAVQRTRLCAEFAHAGRAEEFVREFVRERERTDPEPPVEILLSESVPEIEALTAVL